MALESEISEVQSLLERLISSRNRDLSLFIPFLLGFSITDPDEIRPDSDQNQRDRIILINPLTHGMMVIEGTWLDALLRSAPGKDGPPPASKSSIESMPSVEIREGEEGDCVICLEEWVNGVTVKEMPCKHKFHGGCIEKWLGMHASCPVCRFEMPVDGEEPGKKEEGGERMIGERDIWVSFSFGGSMRRTEHESTSGDGDRSQMEERESETGN